MQPVPGESGHGFVTVNPIHARMLFGEPAVRFKLNIPGYDLIAATVIHICNYYPELARQFIT